MFVEITILRPAGPPATRGGGAWSKIFCWAAGGRVEYSGTTFTSPTCGAAHRPPLITPPSRQPCLRAPLPCVGANEWRPCTKPELLRSPTPIPQGWQCRFRCSLAQPSISRSNGEKERARAGEGGHTHLVANVADLVADLVASVLDFLFQERRREGREPASSRTRASITEGHRHSALHTNLGRGLSNTLANVTNSRLGARACA